MDFVGVVYRVLPVQSGTSARGQWQKQEVVFELPDEFSRKVCVTFFGDRVSDAASLKPRMMMWPSSATAPPTQPTCVRATAYLSLSISSRASIMVVGTLMFVRGVSRRCSPNSRHLLRLQFPICPLWQRRSLQWQAARSRLTICHSK